MTDVFLQDGELWLKFLLRRLHRVELIVEHVDLSVFLNALENDLLEILVSFLQQPRVKDGLFNMRVSCEFVADLFVYRPTLGRLHAHCLREKCVDHTVVQFQSVDCVHIFPL